MEDKKYYTKEAIKKRITERIRQPTQATPAMEKLRQRIMQFGKGR